MSTSRSRRFPFLTIIKLLLACVIAAALVKIAFFPTVAAEEPQTLDPSFEIGQLTVMPESGSISNSLSLEGTVESDPASTIKATFQGEVTQFYVNDGAAVAEGDALLLLARQEQGEDVTTTDEEGNQVVTPGKKVWWSQVIYAPSTGTLHLSALEGQQFQIGDSLGTVQPPTFSAVASLTPDQMYRIQSVPDTASITIKNGPAPFECSGLTIVTPQTTSSGTGSSADSGTGTTGSSTSIHARCAVPADQTVFAGLQVTMGIIAGEATDVLTLPVSAVEGRYQTGFVYKPTEDLDAPEKVGVTLGITDGKRVQIVDGVTDADEVLEFVPSDDTAMECNTITGEGC